ncbi:diaminopimelate decarboxylase [Periweissella cryptocerci]|uniref:Diaminopimelate decarboxylase n=1 Tax=Periweissella cryptocerci TaxID=2506420 RepID=A0A4P6YW90_9LACO|nr:diaminopimelate decarboxylase [Periweissella cryptocerci]QBO37051.1 diaminopimelate decarboxylase [Periweissella cryptocerci]
MSEAQLQTNAAGHLSIGGYDAVTLATEFQTPLVVYDVAKIRQQIRDFKQVFNEENINYAVSYASKAFATIAMYQVVAQEGAHIDVVSGGELYTAMQADFPMADVSFHGNNKAYAELEMAVDAQVGAIIVDNFDELAMLTTILAAKDTRVNVMLRLTPGISAHTHEYDQTGQTDSKFGFDIESGQARQALDFVLANDRFQMRGIHAHIGSQIFEVTGFVAAAEKLVATIVEWRDAIGYEPEVINVGGGFGIRYTTDDDPIPASDFVKAIIQAVKQATATNHLAMPAIWIEPGRSIVGEAGYSLYTVGTRKVVPDLLPYINVDGGMGDNIRPALYQAKYEAILANNPQAPTTRKVRISGKYCESGDILVYEQDMPAVQTGDIIALLATGAYGYSMASNYNRNPRPAVVFIENGAAKVVVERETYADLVRLDRSYL